MEDLRRCGGEDLLVCRYTTWRRTSFEPCPIVNFPIHNGDSWTKGPKHWDISPLLPLSPSTHPLGPTLLRKYLKLLLRLPVKDISLYCVPNRETKQRLPTENRWRAGGKSETKTRSRNRRRSLSLSLSISLLEISCNFDSRGVQVSRGREIFGTPARIVVDGSTRDERIDACQFRYYFSWGSILFLLS